MNQMYAVVVEFFATFFIWFLFIGLGVLWLIDGRIKKEQVVHALMACFFAWCIAFIIKLIFPTLRPFAVNGHPIDVLIRPKDGAFPSEHSTLAFALATTIFMHDRKIGVIYMVAAALVGAARVLANVHYPIDIFGGALLGTLVAVFVEKVHFFKLLSNPQKSNRKRSR